MISTKLVWSESIYGPNKAAAMYLNADHMDGAYEDENCEINLHSSSTDIPTYLSGSLYRIGSGYWDPLFNVHQNDTHSHLFFGLGMIHTFHFDKYHDENKVSYYGKFQKNRQYEKYFYGSTDKQWSSNNQATIRRIRNYDGTYTLLCNGGNSLSNSFNRYTLETEAAPHQYNDSKMWNPLLSLSHSPSHSQTDIDGTIFSYIDVFGIFGAGYYQLYHIKPGTNRSNSNKRIFAPNKVYPNGKGGGQPLFTHSFGITDRFMIICEIPYKPSPDISLENLKKLMFGDLNNLKINIEYLGDDILNYVTWYVVDKYSGELYNTFVSDLFIYFHTSNAYEVDNEVIVDLAIYTSDDNKNIDLFDVAYIENILANNEGAIELGCNSKLYRFVLPMDFDKDPDDPINIDFGHPLSEWVGVELPMINYENYNTQQYQYVYMAGYSYCNLLKDNDENYYGAFSYDMLIKQRISIYPDRTVYDALYWHETNHYVSEPVFVPNTNNINDIVDEDDGVILSMVLNGNSNSSYLLILNAKSFTEIARIKPKLQNAIPITFHGRYYKF